MINEKNLDHIVRFCTLQLIVIVGIFFYSTVWAADYSFSWTANSEDVDGYKLYYKKDGTAAPPFDGTDASDGASPIVLGNVTTFTIHNLQAETTYHFALTAYSGSEESDYTDVITVYPDATDATETLSATIIASTQTGEAPLEVTFDGTNSTGDISTYTWDFGDESEMESSSVTTHTYASSGTYTATLTVASATGESASATIPIYSTESDSSTTVPTAVISTSENECTAPCSILFDGSQSSTENSSITSYLWNFGDGGSASAVSSEHLYSDPGIYLVTLQVEDSAGASNQTSTSVVINTAASSANELPTPVISATPTYGAAPLVVTFDGTASSDSDGSIKEYLWDFGDGTTSFGSTAEHTYAATGQFTATLTVIDDQGGTATTSQVISVVSSTYRKHRWP